VHTEKQWNGDLAVTASLDAYCSPASMLEHEEGCDKRPTQIAKLRLCPSCGSVLEKVLPATWICVNRECDFTMDVLPGGKLP